MATPQDRGVISGFVVALAVCLVVMAGLAIDSGRLVAARVRASDHAENVARLASQEVSLIRLGIRTIDRERAQTVAQEYFDQNDLDGSILVSHQSVTATVRIEQDTTLLHLVGIGTRSVAMTRTASLVSG